MLQNIVGAVNNAAMPDQNMPSLRQYFTQSVASLFRDTLLKLMQSNTAFLQKVLQFVVLLKSTVFSDLKLNQHFSKTAPTETKH